MSTSQEIFERFIIPRPSFQTVKWSIIIIVGMLLVALALVYFRRIKMIREERFRRKRLEEKMVRGKGLSKEEHEAITWASSKLGIEIISVFISSKEFERVVDCYIRQKGNSDEVDEFIRTLRLKLGFRERGQDRRIYSTRQFEPGMRGELFLPGAAPVSCSVRIVRETNWSVLIGEEVPEGLKGQAQVKLKITRPDDAIYSIKIRGRYFGKPFPGLELEHTMNLDRTQLRAFKRLKLEKVVVMTAIRNRDQLEYFDYNRSFPRGWDRKALECVMRDISPGGMALEVSEEDFDDKYVAGVILWSDDWHPQFIAQTTGRFQLSGGCLLRLSFIDPDARFTHRVTREIKEIERKRLEHI